MTIFRLFRLPNLLVILLTMVGSQNILNSAFGKCPLHTNFWLLTLATICIAAAGNVLNDFFDQATDKINKPERVIVGNRLTSGQALSLYAVLNFAALVIGWWLPGPFCLFWSFCLFPAVIFLLFLYNWKLKCTPLLGNLLVAGLCALVPMQLMWLYRSEQHVSELNWPKRLVIYTVFAFVLTLWREVVKDLEDIKGEREVGCKTLPVAIGEDSVRWFARILGLGILLALGWVVFTQFEGDTRFLVLPVLVIPSVVAEYWLWQEGHSVFYQKASILIKLAMVAGLIALAMPAN